MNTFNFDKEYQSLQELVDKMETYNGPLEGFVKLQQEVDRSSKACLAWLTDLEKQSQPTGTQKVNS